MGVTEKCAKDQLMHQVQLFPTALWGRDTLQEPDLRQTGQTPLEYQGRQEPHVYGHGGTQLGGTPMSDFQDGHICGPQTEAREPTSSCCLGVSFEANSSNCTPEETGVSEHGVSEHGQDKPGAPPVVVGTPPPPPTRSRAQQ